MKKILIIVFSTFLIYVAVKFIFSYTIFNVPYMFGTRTYVGHSKYDFPICIVNPLKAKNVKKDILYYLNHEKETNIYDKENICNFFGKLNSSFDFDIISVNTDSKNENSFLLQLKGLSRKKCVVFIDKKSKQIVKFGF